MNNENLNRLNQSEAAQGSKPAPLMGWDSRRGEHEHPGSDSTSVIVQQTSVAADVLAERSHINHVTREVVSSDQNWMPPFNVTIEVPLLGGVWNRNRGNYHS